mgnify:CR=1 FL=1
MSRSANECVYVCVCVLKSAANMLFGVEIFCALYKYSFIHSFIQEELSSKKKEEEKIRRD